MSEEMMIQVYSTKELLQEIRTTFQLPTDPYDPVPERQKLALDYLKSLNIVFYRDEDHGVGILVDLPNDGSIEEFQGFTSTAMLSVEDGSIVSWLNKPGYDKKRRNYVVKKGDDKAWVRWNDPVTVLSMNEERVQVV